MRGVSPEGGGGGLRVSLSILYLRCEAELHKRKRHETHYTFNSLFEMRLNHLIVDGNYPVDTFNSLFEMPPIVVKGLRLKAKGHFQFSI